MKPGTAATVLTILAFVLAGAAPADAADAAARNIEIVTPWIRASPPIARVGAAYFTINATATPDRLLGATTPAAERVEIHATVDNNGVMQMRQQTEVAVAPGKPAALAPGGTHLMLLNLRTPLTAGTTVTLVLSFEHAGEIRIEVPVFKDAPASPAQHQGHH